MALGILETFKNPTYGRGLLDVAPDVQTTDQSILNYMQNYDAANTAFRLPEGGTYPRYGSVADPAAAPTTGLLASAGDNDAAYQMWLQNQQGSGGRDSDDELFRSMSSPGFARGDALETRRWSDMNPAQLHQSTINALSGESQFNTMMPGDGAGPMDWMGWGVRTGADALTGGVLSMMRAGGEYLSEADRAEAISKGLVEGTISQENLFDIGDRPYLSTKWDSVVSAHPDLKGLRDDYNDLARPGATGAIGGYLGTEIDQSKLSPKAQAAYAKYTAKRDTLFPSSTNAGAYSPRAMAAMDPMTRWGAMGKMYGRDADSLAKDYTNSVLRDSKLRAQAAAFAKSNPQYSKGAFGYLNLKGQKAFAKQAMEQGTPAKPTKKDTATANRINVERQARRDKMDRTQKSAREARVKYEKTNPFREANIKNVREDTQGDTSWF